MTKYALIGWNVTYPETITLRSRKISGTRNVVQQLVWSSSKKVWRPLRRRQVKLPAFGKQGCYDYQVNYSRAERRWKDKKLDRGRQESGTTSVHCVVTNEFLLWLLVSRLDHVSCLQKQTVQHYVALMVELNVNHHLLFCGCTSVYRCIISRLLLLNTWTPWHSCLTVFRQGAAWSPPPTLSVGGTTLRWRLRTMWTFRNPFYLVLMSFALWRIRWVCFPPSWILGTERCFRYVCCGSNV